MGQGNSVDDKSSSPLKKATDALKRIASGTPFTELAAKFENSASAESKFFYEYMDKHLPALKSQLIRLKNKIAAEIAPHALDMLKTVYGWTEKDGGIATVTEVIAAGLDTYFNVGGFLVNTFVLPGAGTVLANHSKLLSDLVRSRLPIVILRMLVTGILSTEDKHVDIAIPKAIDAKTGGYEDHYTRYMHEYKTKRGKTGGLDMPKPNGIIAEYAESISADARNAMIDDLITVLDQLGFKSTASDRIAKLKEVLEKIQKINIKDSDATQKSVCNKIAGAINDRFGPVVDMNVTDMKVKCNQIAQFIVSMMSGTHVSLAAMTTQLQSLIGNSAVVLKFARESVNAIKNGLDEKPDIKLKLAEHFAVLDISFAEYERNLNNLKTLLSVKLNPTDKLITELIQGTHFYKDDTITVPTGMQELSVFLKNVLSGTAVSALTAAEFQRAATQLHLGMQELNSEKAAELLRKKYEEELLKMKPTDYQGIKTLEAMHSYIKKYLPYAGEVAKVLENKTGSDEEETVGGNDDEKTHYEKVTESRRKLRTAITEVFQRKLGEAYERMIGALSAISMKVGTADVPLGEQLDGFRDMLGRFAKEQIVYKNVHYALMGFYRDPLSVQIRDTTINQINMMVSYLSSIIDDSSYVASKKLFEELRSALTGIVQLITEYGTSVRAKFGADDDDVVDEHGAHRRLGGDDARIGGADEPRSYVFKHISEFVDHVEKFDYFYRVAQIKKNLAHTNKELEKYAEKYEEMLAKSVATKIGELHKEYQQKLADIARVKDGAVYKNMGAVAKASLAKEIAAAEEFAKQMYEARKKFWNTLESIDAYMRHFTVGVARNPADIKEIKAMLDNVNIQEPWYNNNTGHNIALAFDSMRGYSDNGMALANRAAAVAYNADDNYYTTIERPGIPFDMLKPTDGKTLVGKIKNALGSFRLLKNFMMLFIHIGDKFGGMELYKKSFMTPKQIYDNIVEYLNVCSFMQGHRVSTSGYTIGEIRARLGLSNLVSDTGIGAGTIPIRTAAGAVGTVDAGIDVAGGALGSFIINDPTIKNIGAGALAVTDPSYDNKLVVATGQTLADKFDMTGERGTSNIGTYAMEFDPFTGVFTISVNAPTTPFTTVGTYTNNNSEDFMKLRYGVVFRSIPVNQITINNPTSFAFNNEGQQTEDHYFVSAIKAMAAKVLTTVGVYDLFERPAKYYSYMPVRMIIGGAEGEDPKINDNVTDLYYRLPLLVLFYKKLFLYDAGTDTTGGRNAKQYVDYSKDFARYKKAIKITMIPDVDGVFGPLINYVFRNPFFEQQYVFSDDDVRFIVREVNAIHTKLAPQAEGKDVTMHIIRALVDEVNRRYGIVQISDKEQLDEELRFRYNHNNADVTGWYRDNNGNLVPDFNDAALLPGEDDLQVEMPAPSDKWVSKAAAGRRADLPSKFNIALGQRELLYNFRCMLESGFGEYWGQSDMAKSNRTLSLKHAIKDTQTKLKKETSDSERLKILGSLLRGGKGLTKGETMKYLMFHETVIASLNAVGALYAQTRDFVASIMSVSINDLLDAFFTVLSKMSNVAVRGLDTNNFVTHLITAYESKFGNGFDLVRHWPGLRGSMSAGAVNGGLEAATEPSVKRDHDDPGIDCIRSYDFGDIAAAAGANPISTAAMGANSSVCTILGGIPQNVNWREPPAADKPAIEVFKRFVFDKEYMMKVLVESLYGFSNDLQGLVTLRIENGKFIMNFEKLKETVTEMLGYASYFIEFFRPHFDSEFIDRYVNKFNLGSLYWYQEQLVEKLIEGRKGVSADPSIEAYKDPVKEYVSIPRAVQAANQTFEFLTQKFGYTFNGNVTATQVVAPPVAASYDKIFAGLIYYDAAKPASGIVASTEAPNVVDNKVIDATTIDKHVPYDGPKFVDYLGRDNQVEMLHFHSSGEKRVLDTRYAARFKQLYTFGKEFTYNRSLMFMFNQLLAKYLAQMFDGSTQKAYSGAFNDLFGSPMSQSITDQNYTWPDTWPCVFLKFGKSDSTDDVKFMTVSADIEAVTANLQDKDSGNADFAHSRAGILPGSFNFSAVHDVANADIPDVSALADERYFVIPATRDVIITAAPTTTLRRVAFRKKHTNDRFSRYDLTRSLFAAKSFADAEKLYFGHLVCSFAKAAMSGVQALLTEMKELQVGGILHTGNNAFTGGAATPMPVGGDAADRTKRAICAVVQLGQILVDPYSTTPIVDMKVGLDNDDGNNQLNRLYKCVTGRVIATIHDLAKKMGILNDMAEARRANFAKSVLSKYPAGGTYNINNIVRTDVTYTAGVFGADPTDYDAFCGQYAAAAIIYQGSRIFSMVPKHADADVATKLDNAHNAINIDSWEELAFGRAIDNTRTYMSGNMIVQLKQATHAAFDAAIAAAMNAIVADVNVGVAMLAAATAAVAAMPVPVPPAVLPVAGAVKADMDAEMIVAGRLGLTHLLRWINARVTDVAGNRVIKQVALATIAGALNIAGNVGVAGAGGGDADTNFRTLAPNLRVARVQSTFTVLSAIMAICDFCTVISGKNNIVTNIMLEEYDKLTNDIYTNVAVRNVGSKLTTNVCSVVEELELIGIKAGGDDDRTYSNYMYHRTLADIPLDAASGRADAAAAAPVGGAGINVDTTSWRLTDGRFDQRFANTIRAIMAPAAEEFVCWMELSSLFNYHANPDGANYNVAQRRRFLANPAGASVDLMPPNHRSVRFPEDVRIGAGYNNKSPMSNTYSYIASTGTTVDRVDISIIMKICELYMRGITADIDRLDGARDRIAKISPPAVKTSAAHLATTTPEYKELVTAMSIGENDALVGIEKETALQLATDKLSNYVITQLALQNSPSLFKLFGKPTSGGNYDWGNGDEYDPNAVADAFHSWKMFGPLMDPDRERILFTSISVMLKNLQTSRHPSTQASMHLTDSIAELPAYLKERMKVAAPGFRTLFQALSNRCNFIKGLLETSIDVRRGWAHCDMTYTVAPDNVANAPLNNPWPGHLLKTTVDSNDTKVRFRGICEAVSNGCTYMIKCCDRVSRDLADDPKYLELYDGSIKDYKSQNSVEPLMPLTSVFDAFTSVENKYSEHNIIDESKYLPVHNFGNSRFKMLYGMRHLWFGNNVVEPQHVPGFVNILADYNNFVVARDQLPKDKADAYLKAFIKTTRRINELKNIRSVLTPLVSRLNINQYTGLKTLGDLQHYQLVNGSLSFYRHDVFNVTAVTTAALPVAGGPVGMNDWLLAHVKTNKAPRSMVVNDVHLLDAEFAATASKRSYYVPAVYQVTAKHAAADSLFDKTLSLTESTFKMERIEDIANYVAGKDLNKMERLDLINIMDMNIIPINVHALMRDIPFANIYNYAYTFDRLLVEMMYGKGKVAEDKLNQLCDTTNPTPINSSKDLFVKLMNDPYHPIDLYNNHLRGIMTGDNNMSKLPGRPKFISDQLYNKVLFGSLYTTANHKTEKGPTVHDTMRTPEMFANYCEMVMDSFMGGPNQMYNLEWIWARLPSAVLVGRFVNGLYGGINAAADANRPPLIAQAFNRLRADMRKYYIFVAENPMTNFRELYTMLFSDIDAAGGRPAHWPESLVGYGGTLSRGAYSYADMANAARDDDPYGANARANSALLVRTPAQFILTAVPLVLVAGWHNRAIPTDVQIKSTLALLIAILRLSNPSSAYPAFGMQRNNALTRNVGNVTIFANPNEILRTAVAGIVANNRRNAHLQAAVRPAAADANVSVFIFDGIDGNYSADPKAAIEALITTAAYLNLALDGYKGALGFAAAATGNAVIHDEVMRAVIKSMFTEEYQFNSNDVLADNQAWGTPGDVVNIGDDLRGANIAAVARGPFWKSLLKTKIVLPDLATKGAAGAQFDRLVLKYVDVNRYIQYLQKVKPRTMNVRGAITPQDDTKLKGADQVGMMRFNTVFIRNMIFINNVYRVLTSKFRNDLLQSGQGRIIQKSLAVINPKVTEFVLNNTINYDEEDQ